MIAGMDGMHVASLREKKNAVSHQTHVLRQPTFFFSSMLSVITVDIPRSCLVRTGVAYIGKPSICDPPTMSFSSSSAR